MARPKEFDVEEALGSPPATGMVEMPKACGGEDDALIKVAGMVPERLPELFQFFVGVPVVPGIEQSQAP